MAGVALPTLLVDRGVTRREAEVLTALAERLTNAEIAARLYLSERTVESHVTSLLRKLQVRNRVDLGDVAKDLAAARSRRPAPLPAAVELLLESTPLVGRTAELARLRELWDRAQHGRLLVGLVAGEAGIGKSRLVAEFAAEVAAGGAQVLWGACFEDLEAPYQPFEQAISTDLKTQPEAELRRRAAGGHLSWLVPELTGTAAASASDEISDPVAAQAELLASLHTYLTRAAEASPLLLVVEDMHWATSTTLAAVRHLGRVSGRAPILVVVTTRYQSPDLHGELAVVVAELGRLPAVERLDLAGLDETEVGELLAALGAHSNAATVRADTGGNPLFVRELATGAPGWVGPVRGLLSRHYSLLGVQDLAVLDVAAVVGQEFDADLLATAVRYPLPVVLESLERSEAAGVVARVPERPGRFTFLHALFRAARYDDIAPVRRGELHAQIAAALCEQAHDDPELAELARHTALAVTPGDKRPAIDRLIGGAELAQRSRRALRDLGDRAWSLNDYATAAHAYQAALKVWPAGDPERPSLLLALGRAMCTAERRGRDILIEARNGLQASGDEEGVADAEVMLGDLEWIASRWNDASSHFDRAAALLRHRPPSRRTAHVLANLARLRLMTGGNRDAREHGTRALEMARDLELEALEADVLITIGTAQVNDGDLGGLGALQAGVEIAERLDSPTVARGYANLRVSHSLLGELPRARQWHRRAGAAAERFGLAETLRWARAHETADLFDVGRWDDALAAAEAFLVEFEDSSYYLVTVCLRVRARVRMGRGNPIGALADAAAAAEFARGARHPSNLLVALPFYARCLFESGRAADADATIDEALLAAVGHETNLEPIDTAIVMAAIGREAEFVDVAGRSRLQSARQDVGRAIAQGNLTEAGDRLAHMEHRSAEAFVRLLAAERLVVERRHRVAEAQLRRALAFHRSVGATAYVARGERLATALQ